MPVEIRMLCGHRFAVSEADSTKDMRCPFCKDKPALASLSSRDEALGRREGARADELDIHGDLFGLKFTDGCSNGCVELYIEDDEWWHHKLTVDRGWLKDLHTTVERALRSPAEQNADRFIGDPPGTVSTDSVAPDRSPIHTPTEDCGFDRNGSHNAGHYVCMCGWEDSTDRAIHDTPDRSPGGGADGMPEEPKEIAQFRGVTGGWIISDTAIRYIDALRQWALRRPAPSDGIERFMEKLGTVLRDNGFPDYDVATIRSELTAALAASPEAGGAAK